MKSTLVAGAIALSLSLAACATGDDPTSAVNNADFGYQTWCAFNTQNDACSDASRAKEAHAYQAALDGIAAYEAGNLTAEQEHKLISDLIALIADFEK